VELTLTKECWIKLGTGMYAVTRVTCLENGNTMGFLTLIVSRYYTKWFLLLLKQFFLLPKKLVILWISEPLFDLLLESELLELDQ
jgi:hypothetical protein